MPALQLICHAMPTPDDLKVARSVCNPQHLISLLHLHRSSIPCRLHSVFSLLPQELCREQIYAWYLKENLCVLFMAAAEGQVSCLSVQSVLC